MQIGVTHVHDYKLVTWSQFAIFETVSSDVRSSCSLLWSPSFIICSTGDLDVVCRLQDVTEQTLIYVVDENEEQDI